jgi:hypothetical protein
LLVSNVIDFNDGRPQGYFSPRQIDPSYVPNLKASLESQAASFLSYLWPAGRVVAGEFQVGGVNGEAGKSLKISLKPGKIGVGADFAGNVICGDLLDCAAYAWHGRKASGRDFADIVERIEGYLGMPMKPKASKGERESLPPPSAIYPYTDAAGAMIVQVLRYDTPAGKTFRQQPKLSPDGRPLFNLPSVAKAGTVLFVEGEKAATAAIGAGVVATCAIGGASSGTEKTDWTPLAGKKVIIWPDADEPGLAYAEAVRLAVEKVGASPTVICPPQGKPKGWDCADAIIEGVNLQDYLANFQPRTALAFRLEDFAAQSFAGEPKPIEWLVKGIMPLGKAGLLVAMGDAGKGILTLDLALKIAADKQPGDLHAMGGEVSATGSVVILAAEDDHDTIHRRLHSLDPGGQRRASGRLFVVPLPNAGGPVPIIKNSSTSGPYVTPEWGELKKMLAAVDDLRLVVLDPLASFVHADVNADPAAGAFVTGCLASLATETGATVLLPHHMAKRERPIASPEEARNAIRGSTAIVDGVRFAYALWHADEHEAKRVCLALGEEWARNRVLMGCVVKSNDPVDRTIRTYVRSLKTGLLIDRTDAVLGSKVLAREALLDRLEGAIAAAAVAGYPYTKTGGTGLWNRRGELPGDLKRIGKNAIEDMVNELMNRQRILAARLKESQSTSNWLDVPGGAIDTGIAELKAGSYRPFPE